MPTLPPGAIDDRLQRVPVRSGLEALLSLLTGTVAQPISGLAGLAQTPNGYEAAANTVDGVQQALTYQPRDPRVMNGLASLASPVMSRYEAMKQGMGNALQDRGYGPGLATAAYTLPDALLSVMGARSVPKGGPSLSQMVENAARPGPSGFAGTAQVGALMPEYGMAHRPVTVAGGAAQVHDLTPAFGGDIYGPQAAQYFGTGDRALDSQTLRVLQSVRGKPDAMVTIYRAVPKGVASQPFNYGDWVTVNRNYAKLHGESTLNGDYQIIEQRVPASHLTTNADSFHEQGYHPPK